MTALQKVALSLLISVLLFGGFSALVFTTLFDLIEAHFYNPSIINSVARENARTAGVVDDFLAEMQDRFSGTLQNPAVQRSFLPNQSAEDIFERSRIYGLLSEDINGLQWVRFIDQGGVRLHFSTHSADILTQDPLSIAYSNFYEPGFPFEVIAVRENEDPKMFFDEVQDRILFSFPFFDSLDVYRGTALFSLSITSLSQRLIRLGTIKASQEISVISNPQGLLTGVHAAVETVLPSQVSAIWREDWQRPARLVSPHSGLSLTLVSVMTSQGFLIGQLVNEELFTLPLTMKIILLASFFFTVFLTVFLLFNLRQDTFTIVQNRLKQLQISFIDQFYEQKSDMDWARWSRDLEKRRDEINAQLKQGVKNFSAAQAADLDVLIDKSWDELLSVMGSRSLTASQNTGIDIDDEKLKVILNRILEALPNALPGSIPALPQAKAPSAATLDTAPAYTQEEPEEIEELDELDEVEELDEAGELEEIEELEEIQEAEELGEVEALDDAETDSVLDLIEMEVPAEIADEILFSPDSADEAEELEELEELEEAEAQDEVDVLDKIEVFDDLDMMYYDEEPVAAKEKAMSTNDFASNIEFSTEDEPDSVKSEDDFVDEDLEIVSPFSTMLFDLMPQKNADSTAAVENETAEEVSGALPAAPAGQGHLPYEPFAGKTGESDIELLESVTDNDNSIDGIIFDDSSIIEEREGIHYIDENALDSESADTETLDQDFKALVDSVIKP